MAYLAAAIIFASLFSVIFKISQNKGIDTRQVIFFNYSTAVLVSCVGMAARLFSGEAIQSDYSLHSSSCAYAVVEGILFALGFILMDRSVWRSGVALTTVSARASLILPVIFSWAFLAQSAPAWLPVGIVLVSLLLIILPAESQEHPGAKLTGKTEAQRRRRVLLVLFLVFVCLGTSDFMMKVAQQSVSTHLAENASAETHIDSLTALIFVAASLAALVYCLTSKSFKKHPVRWKSLLMGVLLGVVNLIGTSCSLRALAVLSTGLYYPIYNIGIVLVSTLVGVLLFKERIKWIQFVGMAMAVAAILLFFR